MSNKDPLGIAIVGCGRISQQHLKAAAALPDDVRVVAVVDMVEAKARERADEFGIDTVYTKLADALADDRVQAAIVCTQPVFHAPLGVEIAAAGRHVLIEKPLCLTVREADDLVRAGKDHGVVVMSGQSRRFNDEVFAARKMIEEGRIGALRHITAVAGSRTQGPPIAWWGDPAFTGPNALLANWASHWLDQILYLANRPPRRVFAEATDHHPLYAGEDSWSMVIRFEDDLVAAYTHSFSAAFEHANAFAYAGSEGTINIGRGFYLNGEKVEEVGGNINNFTAQLREFAAAIREERAPLCAAEEVRPVIAVCDAALVSAREHRAVEI